jgi:peptide/nickel transport system permease protein
MLVAQKLRKRYSPARLKEADPQSWALWPLVFQDPYRRVRANEWPGRPGNPAGTEGRPSRLNWLGTTPTGVDVFAQLVHGARVALLVGFVSTGIAAVIGITLGALAGYVGGWLDVLLSRAIEVMMCVPALVLILALLAVVDKTTIWHTMVVLGLTGWTGIARLMRAEFLKLREMEYVLAARALGAGQARVMFRHILPNALAPVLVPITFGIASAILIENALSFLGFGSPPPNASWGNLLKEGQRSLSMWWLVVFPGTAIFLTVLAYNLIGETLQEATDPRLREAAK